ncbi:hypothetical protein FBUS_01235 [Fasciolopsis buskii]|uniref:Ubiquitin-like domain-containing protein n=1 Tax=Fasciolopsis buskii TaxID=27845 RepID=A0A8E0S2M1_9TREM|nr:hypothetical protein FBUS_01235 [Fasciolopsis buski]
MRLDVYLPNGHVIIVNVDPQGHVSQIDEELEKQVGSLPIGACYYDNNYQLNNSKRIADCHLQEGSKIFLHCPLLNGSPYFNCDKKYNLK